MSKSNVFAGDHPEDVEVLRTVCQGQFNLHGVVVGVGEDAVLRYVLYWRAFLECGLLPVDGEYHNTKGGCVIIAARKYNRAIAREIIQILFKNIININQWLILI